MSDQVFGVGPQGYATGQLSRALAALARAGASKTERERAEAKARRWREVIDGLASGRVTVGSRTPVADLPAWVTLEVLHGGFATGRGLAETPLTDDESALVAALPSDVPGDTARERLNLWYLGDAGQAELLRALRTGHYRIRIPEHAALLVVALLLDKGFPEQALDLVAELRPYLSRLRFTPDFDPVARLSGPSVRVVSVSEAADALRAVRTPEQLSLMRATIEVWTPLYDRLVALWCETVDGELPRLDHTGAVTGGRPGVVRPPHWTRERARWLDDFATARRAHAFHGRHAHRKSNFAHLHRALLDVAHGNALSPRQAGQVRRALANTLTRHGEPGSAARDSARSAQAEAIAGPLYTEFAAVLATRLDRYPADGGLPSSDPATTPIEPGDRVDIADGTGIPRHLQGKAIRALEAPAEELVRRGIIGSGEVLAAVLPQLTSRLLAADLADPAAASLYEQLYTAFRRRRGLLLLNLQHQVRFDELPWVTALHVMRTPPSAPRTGKDTGAEPAPDTAAAARRLLRQTALLAIESFPQALLPNPLVREFHTLAQQADVRLPLVEEVAADIFMGTFTKKWRTSALMAGAALEGTLYQRYYDLPAVADWNSNERNETRWGKTAADDFTELCIRRSAEAGEGSNYVARNGALLEQGQILTTHNLAALVTVLELDAQLRETAPELARRAFAWIVRCLSRPADRHTALIQVKNAAYAWRQGVFLLSYCDLAAQREQVDRLREHVGATNLSPATDGLAHIVNGGRFGPDGFVPDSRGRRFLGWTVGRHWYFG